MGPPGGGGGSTPSPMPSVSPSPAFHPAGIGDTFDFTGTETQTVVRFVPTPTPPAQTTNLTITQDTTVQAAGCTGAADFHTIETDAATNQTITTTSDNCFQIPSNGTGSVVETGFSSTDSNGVNIMVALGSGNGIIDMIPESAGQNWTNNAAETFNETNPDGSTTSRTVNADGSYTESDTGVAGTTTVTENAGLTGGNENAPTGGSVFGCEASTTFAVSAPSGGNIPVTISPVGCPNPTPTPIAFTVTDWYTLNTLANDMIKDTGPQPIPAGCANASFGSTGNELAELKQRLDTVLGFTDTENIRTWVVFGFGPVCVQLQDTFTLYYDFTGQQQNGIYSSTPQQTTTATETLGLQSETLHAVARQPLSTSRASEHAFAARVALAEASIDRLRSQLRMKQVRRLTEWLSKKRIHP